MKERWSINAGGTQCNPHVFLKILEKNVGHNRMAWNYQAAPFPVLGAEFWVFWPAVPVRASKVISKQNRSTEAADHGICPYWLSPPGNRRKPSAG